MPSTSPTIPYVLIVIAGITWGGTFSLALIAASDGTHPLALATWQAIISAVAFAAICTIGKVPVFSRRRLRNYVVIAVIGICLPNLLYYNAAPHLSAGILSITVSTVPLFTYAIMWAMRYEPLMMKRALGIVLGMVAILLLVIPDQGLSSDDANFWTLMVVLCAICYAVENVYIDEGIDHRVDIREILSGGNIIAAIALIPITTSMDIMTAPEWLLSDSGLAITGIALCSVVAYTMFFYTIKMSGPVFASQCAYVVTIAGVLWGVALFGEQHTVWIWSSLLVVTIGLALVTPVNRADNTVSAQEASE